MAVAIRIEREIFTRGAVGLTSGTIHELTV
jgi:hypothetical protein